jgi:hypothetical protein
MFATRERRNKAKRFLHVLPSITVVLEVVQNARKRVVEIRGINGYAQSHNVRVRRVGIRKVVKEEIAVAQNDVVIGDARIRLDLGDPRCDDLAERINNFANLRGAVRENRRGRGIIGDEAPASNVGFLGRTRVVRESEDAFPDLLEFLVRLSQ